MPTSFKASDIIADALFKLGVYADAENVTDADYAQGLLCLNDMLDQWQNESLFVYSLTTLTLNLANGTPTYSIGPTGSFANIVTGRPDKIQTGKGAASVVSGSTTYPVNVVSRMEWNGIQSINPGTGVPDTLFYDPQYPVGILNLAPTPHTTGMVLTFYKLVPFASFATYATAAAFSQGTVDALKNNLAAYAKPYFAVAQIDPIIISRADTGKEFLRTSGTTSRARLKRAQSPVAKPTDMTANR